MQGPVGVEYGPHEDAIAGPEHHVFTSCLREDIPLLGGADEQRPSLAPAQTAATPSTAVSGSRFAECTMLAPIASKTGTVDVRATVSKKTSKKYAPADDFAYD
jgi:hypothetical protein